MQRWHPHFYLVADWKSLQSRLMNQTCCVRVDVASMVIHRGRATAANAGGKWKQLSSSMRASRGIDQTSHRSLWLVYINLQELSSSWDGQPFGHSRHGSKIGRQLGPHVTQCLLGRGLPPYQVVSWCIQPFGHNRHGQKLGGGLCPFLQGELGPHLTQYGLCWGLPPCQVSFWSIQPFGYSAPTLQTDRQQSGPIV